MNDCFKALFYSEVSTVWQLSHDYKSKNAPQILNRVQIAAFGDVIQP